MSSEAPPPSYQVANQGTGPRDIRQDTSFEGEEPLPLDEEGRRSMEDEDRPLPEGWIRQMDPSSGHHFYVDTKANPPKSIWEHPYDREDVWQHPGDSGAAQRTQQQRPAQAQRTNTSEKQSLGIRIKDKLTGTTHEEREEGRRQRYRQQLAAEKAYMERRKQMIQAMRQQQMNNPGMMYGGRYGGGMYGAPAYGYQPMYRQRRGGMGMPLAAGMGGGLLGGMMLGGAMDGGFGGGDFGGGDFGGGDMGGGDGGGGE